MLLAALYFTKWQKLGIRSTKVRVLHQGFRWLPELQQGMLWP